MTTVQLDKELVENLKESREYPRQTYNELIRHMLTLFQKTRTKNQYDEFLHKIQQQKMNELWDNPTDEVWDNV
jgi:rRNA pseudouridine-1189 N-methylase Emg1 (Nep1/Mra1 family)